MKPEILFLKQEDLIQAGVMDMPQVLQAMESVFRLHGQGQVENPTKTIMHLEGTDWKSSFISMPVYVGGEVDVAGVKWAAESQQNSKTGDLPMGIDILVLSDPKTVCPVAIMDGTLITALRTAAATGVALKYLANPEAAVAAVIGAGVIGQTNLMMLKAVFPGLQQVKVYDLNAAKAAALAADYAGVYPEVAASESPEAAIVDADVVITATTARQPFVKAEWLKTGSTYAQVGSSEAEDEVILQADRIVVDDWATTKHYAHTAFHRLYQAGQLTDGEVTNLRQIVAGQAPARQNPQEKILFDSFGMGCEDLVVAHHLYKIASAAGIGQKLVLWNSPKWI